WLRSKSIATAPSARRRAIDRPSASSSVRSATRLGFAQPPRARATHSAALRKNTEHPFGLLILGTGEPSEQGPRGPERRERRLEHLARAHPRRILVAGQLGLVKAAQELRRSLEVDVHRGTALVAEAHAAPILERRRLALPGRERRPQPLGREREEQRIA